MQKPQRLLVRYAVDIRRRMKVGPVSTMAGSSSGPDEKVRVAPCSWWCSATTGFLHARDGAILPAVPDETPDVCRHAVVIQPATLMGGLDLLRCSASLVPTAGRGYLRLFVSPQCGDADAGDESSLLDPPITQLRWADE